MILAYFSFLMVLQKVIALFKIHKKFLILKFKFAIIHFPDFLINFILVDVTLSLKDNLPVIHSCIIKTFFPHFNIIFLIIGED